MTLAENISTFLRDAQFRIGEIGDELNAMPSKDSQVYSDLWDLRNDLCQWVEVLYNARFSFIDGAYRFLDEDETGWTEEEIIAEIEYQRFVSNINEIPYLTFAAYYPWIVNNIIGSGNIGIGIPSGSLGQYLVYGLNNSIHGETFPDRCGMTIGESIESYFNGRL